MSNKCSGMEKANFMIKMICVFLLIKTYLLNYLEFTTSFISRKIPSFNEIYFLSN